MRFFTADLRWEVPRSVVPVSARRCKRSTGMSEGPTPKRGSLGNSSLGTLKFSNIYSPFAYRGIVYEKFLEDKTQICAIPLVQKYRIYPSLGETGSPSGAFRFVLAQPLFLLLAQKPFVDELGVVANINQRAKAQIAFKLWLLFHVSDVFQPNSRVLGQINARLDGHHLSFLHRQVG